MCRSTTTRPVRAPASPRSSRARPRSPVRTPRWRPRRSRVQEDLQGRPGHRPARWSAVRSPSATTSPGVDNPRPWTRPTLAKIFDSKITNWNDEAIAKLNPEAKLPDLKIQAFHRSDESGTTDNFTTYLQAAAPKDWKYEPSKSWEAKGGQSAQGSSGVAQQVKQTSGAISYMELSYAKDGMSTVAIKTEAAEPVGATIENATAAIGAAKVVGTGKDLALELDYTPSAEGAYPIVLVTYEIVCDKGNKAETLPATKSFLGLHGLRGRPGPASPTPATPRCRRRSSPRSARPSRGLS
ncbi:hypothetical protein GCM10019016_130410 [Streptomyces prasinosporus]|uniref:PBP domain-containing protein n=1 Tax=Streptomyces prasinosporus TaxID=68256 RepID=A0ABP6UDS5_9ACTN